jgi:hypothetical protein
MSDNEVKQTYVRLKTATGLDDRELGIALVGALSAEMVGTGLTIPLAQLTRRERPAVLRLAA